MSTEADAVVADLEDAVAASEKEAARTVVARCRPPIVRVNGPDTAWFRDDLELVAGLDLHAVMLPKATPETVAELGADGPRIIALVETAEGLRRAYETAAQPRVGALLLGAADLGAELRLEPRSDGLEILYARSKIVADSAAAGIRAPFDIVHLDTRDDVGLEASSRLARSLGFRGKACIHPAQVRIVNAVFQPDAAEVAWATRVIEAFEQATREGRGAIALDGVMVDLPVVERAREIISSTRGADDGN